MEEELKNIEENYNKEESKRNLHILWWAIGIFLFFILLIGGLLSYLIVAKKLPSFTNLSGLNQNTNSTTEDENSKVQPIDLSLDPVQEDLMEADMITLQGSKGEIYLSPMAKYSISAKVMSATNYSSDWQSEFEPTDLALAWDQLTDPELGKGVTYSQSGRWYYYHYDETFKGDGYYIGDHSSNNHIIPANDNIKKAVQNIQVGQNVKIDGYLVNVRYVVAGGEYTQTSSMSRADTGDGACEIIYVKKIQIDDKVYQ